jgi:hypothetical protein
VTAVALIVVVGFNLAGGFSSSNGVAAPIVTPVVPSASPGPSTTPTPTPATTAAASASTAASVCDPDRTCIGPLAVGENTSGSFVVPFTFSAPEGWVNTVDIGRSYKMITSAGVATTIQIMTNVAIIDQTPSCDPVVKKGVGSSVKEIVSYVASHPGLAATAPVPVSIGGYAGQSVDFTVASSWNAMCPDLSTPKVMLLTDTGIPAQRAIGYTQDDEVRWIILDVGGKTVIIELGGSPYSTAFQSGVAEVQPILDSITFTPGN